MTLPSPSELRALADAAERGGFSGWEERSRVVTADARLIALAPALARRVAGLSEWVEEAAEAVSMLAVHAPLVECENPSCDDPLCPSYTARLVARLDEIRGQA